MSNRTLNLSDPVYRYLQRNSLREPAVLRQLRAATTRMPMAVMQITPEQGQFMALLVQMIGARKTLEIGTYTGYSALAVALALPAGGKVIACDINKEWTDLGRRYWKKAGMDRRIKLHLGPGRETMDRLLKSGEAGSFDFIFIDADKENYDTYYEQGLKLLRSGGLLAVDNVLWGGSVANPKKQSRDTRAIRALNRKIHKDKRVSLSMVPIGDGLTLAWKRPPSCR